MSNKEQLRLATRIYIIAHSGNRAYDWMESHGMLRKGWRDPRVRVLSTMSDLEEVREGEGTVFQFLEGWKAGRSPDFCAALWLRFRATMLNNPVKQ